jgi:hypothetical protein
VVPDGGVPAGPESLAEPCRGGPGGDRRPSGRELRTLSNRVFAAMIPAPGADTVTSHPGARAPIV